ncbi:hypothetical protein BASA81_002750 [Batrachochytrium salamandrivorans]|nr:hypothetical protein BASA81_002750 [Batrachochytrium salamandrivorans]
MACFLLLLLLVLASRGEGQLQLRPELYFGAKPPVPSFPFAFSLGWMVRNQFHYDCKEPNQFKRWGFEKCDASYGKQTFTDGLVGLSTEHVFESGGGMLLRINGTGAQELGSIVLVFEFPEGAKEKFILKDALGENDGVRGHFVEAESHLGKIEVDWSGEGDMLPHDPNTCTEHTKRVRIGHPPAELARTHFTGIALPKVTHNLVKEAILSQFAASKRIALLNAQRLLVLDEPVVLDRVTVPLLNNKLARTANLLVLQRVVRFPFSIVVRVHASSSSTVRLFTDKEHEFDTKFVSKLPLAKQGWTEKQVQVAQAALANTLGSIGYFYGQSVLEDGSLTQPASGLLTGVPSRSFFPRGFLWDEGFHQVLVSKFSPSIAARVITSWLEKFDRNGWVAREQILGQDAIDRVPSQFLAQNRQYANPPTLLLAIESLLEQKEDKEGMELFSLALNKFMLHKRWLESSQKSSRSIDGLMAWNGRVGIHTLPSGIDDYPRGVGKEAHVDLLAWSAWEDLQLAKLSRAMKGEVSSELQASAQRKVDLMWKHHWNPQLGFFNDLGDAGFASHVGYVGLIPFCLGLVKPGEEFDRIVAHIEHSLLAKGLGLRSLAKFDKLFGMGENYWRGSVWININYLCVEALRGYAKRDSSAKLAELANTVARAVIGNVVKQYWEGGFLYESYDANTGKGRGTRPFTGWTALIVLLMNSTQVSSLGAE